MGLLAQLVGGGCQQPPGLARRQAQPDPLETIIGMPAPPARFVRQPTRCFSPFLYSEASDFYLHLVYDLGVEEPWSSSRSSEGA